MKTNTVLQSVDISNFSTMRLSSVTDYFACISEAEAIPDMISYAKKRNLRILPIGSGSNIVFAPHIRDTLILRIETHGFSQSGNTVIISAGEPWDDIVAKTVDKKLSGIEALSGVPGTVGAAPVQNIGAYGQEVRETVVLVCGYDTATNTRFTFEKTDCAFGYRDSIFKQNTGRYIITNTTFALSDKKPEIPSYPALQKAFENDLDPTILNIRNTVLKIRSEKLPDPNKTPNVGSFFKNPIISKHEFEKIKKIYSNVPHFPVDDTRVKIPAGWIIEQCGYKGKKINGIGIYEKNALVMVNLNSGTYDAIINLTNTIQTDAREKFGVDLEPEAQIIS